MNIRFSPPMTGVFAGIGNLFRLKGKKDEETTQEPLFVDKDGQEMYKEDVIQFVLDELEKRRSERSALERQWILNANFLVGNQYCDINPYSDEIEQLEPVYSWLERQTFNQIAPLIETRIANLKKINYTMKVKPRTNELDDYAKAEISSALLQYTQDHTDFNTKKNTMIAWNELCGNCFWLAWWDQGGGEPYAVEEVALSGEEGQSYEKKVYYQGDIDYGILSPYEVFPESVFKQGVQAQRSIILEQVKTVDDVYDLYGVRVEGSAVETFELTPLPGSGGFGQENTVLTIGHRSVEDAVRLITYFERPCRKYPNGRMIILAGDQQLLYYGDLPYQRIPIIQVVCREVAGQFFGKSVIEDLIPRQRAYNGCINRIHEFIKRVAIQGYLTEEGSIDIEEYEENGNAPGAMLVYRQGAAPPVPIPNGTLPAEIMAERHNLRTDMEYVAGVSQLMVTGNTPSGVTSGTAISNLMDIDNTRLSLTGDHIRNSVRDLGRLWLEIYKKYASAQRVTQVAGSNSMGGVLIWCGEDINSFDIEYTTENELLMSEDMQKQRFFEAYNLGLFTDSSGVIPQRVKQRALEFMKVGNYNEIMNINQLQIQAAERENALFEAGVLPQVSEFDDHEIHIEEHMRYVLQMRFSLLKMKKPQYAEALENHIRQHKEVVSRIMMQSAAANQIRNMPEQN